MNNLGVDIETYSSVDLKSAGVYAYAASPDFTVLLFAYSYNGSPVQVVDFASGEKIPDEILLALSDPGITKTAFNANFERTCLAVYLKIPMPATQWRCTAVHAATLGLPPSLGEVTEVLGFASDKQKMTIGKSLIRYFSIPCKPTVLNGGRSRNLPRDSPDRWEEFKEYCRRDVEAEMEVEKVLAGFPMSIAEQKLWELLHHLFADIYRGYGIYSLVSTRKFDIKSICKQRR